MVDQSPIAPSRSRMQNPIDLPTSSSELERVGLSLTAVEVTQRVRFGLSRMRTTPTAGRELEMSPDGPLSSSRLAFEGLRTEGY